jgi:DNA-binding LytR/AlgR family response regulator
MMRRPPVPSSGILLDEAGGVEVVGEASNASEAFQLIKAIPYDVVFLDIDMPGLSGVQLAETLAELERQPSIIFVTAHSEHAVKAFEVSATDYLVKPVELDRLRTAIDRLIPARAESARVERIPGREGRQEAATAG